MTEIVERLRGIIRPPAGANPLDLLHEEAADEIERLRSEVHTLSTSCGHCGELESAWQEIERLRASLKDARNGAVAASECAGRIMEDRDEAYADIERLRACVAAARREGIEAALAAVDAEPEPEGDMPAKLANTDKRILVLATVRATKRGIDGRIRALLEEGGR